MLLGSTAGCDKIVWCRCATFASITVSTFVWTEASTTTSTHANRDEDSWVTIAKMASNCGCGGSSDNVVEGPGIGLDDTNTMDTGVEAAWSCGGGMSKVTDNVAVGSPIMWQLWVLGKTVTSWGALCSALMG